MNSFVQNILMIWGNLEDKCIIWTEEEINFCCTQIFTKAFLLQSDLKHMNFK